MSYYLFLFYVIDISVLISLNQYFSNALGFDNMIINFINFSVWRTLYTLHSKQLYYTNLILSIFIEIIVITIFIIVHSP